MTSLLPSTPRACEHRTESPYLMLIYRYLMRRRAELHLIWANEQSSPSLFGVACCLLMQPLYREDD